MLHQDSILSCRVHFFYCPTWFGEDLFRSGGYELQQPIPMYGSVTGYMQL